MTDLLFERGLNIGDLDRAVRDGVSRMTMRVDTVEMVCTPVSLLAAFSELGDDLEVDVRVRSPAVTALRP